MWARNCSNATPLLESPNWILLAQLHVPWSSAAFGRVSVPNVNPPFPKKHLIKKMKMKARDNKSEECHAYSDLQFAEKSLEIDPLATVQGRSRRKLQHPA